MRDYSRVSVTTTFDPGFDLDEVVKFVVWKHGRDVADHLTRCDPRSKGFNIGFKVLGDVTEDFSDLVAKEVSDMLAHKRRHPDDTNEQAWNVIPKTKI